MLHSTGAVTQMGLVTALGGVASLLTGLFAGVVVDRFDRRRLLVLCDLARCGLYASIPLAWLAGPRPWLLYLVLPLASAFAMVFQVAQVTVVPSLVPAEEITRANGRLFAASSTAYLIGPALAGLLSGRFGATAAIGLDAVTFAVSAGALSFLRLAPVTAGGPGSARARSGARGRAVAAAGGSGRRAVRRLAVRGEDHHRDGPAGRLLIGLVGGHRVDQQAPQPGPFGGRGGPRPRR